MFSDCLAWLYPLDDSDLRRPLNSASLRGDSSSRPAGDIEDRRGSAAGSNPADEDGVLDRPGTATSCCGFSWQNCNVIVQGIGYFTASLSNAFPATVLVGSLFSAATGSVTQLPPANNIADTATCTLTPLGLLGPMSAKDPHISAAIFGVTAMFVVPSTAYKILTIRNKPLPGLCTTKGAIAHIAGGFEALLSAHGTVHIVELITAATGGTPGSASAWGNGMGAVVALATWNAMTRVHYNGINAVLATARISQRNLARAFRSEEPEEDFRWETVIDHRTPVSFCAYAYQHPGRAFNVWLAHWGRGMAAYAALVNMFNRGLDWPCNGWTLLSVTCAGGLFAFAFPGRMGLDMAGYAAAELQFQGRARTHNLCCGTRRRPRELPVEQATLTRTDCTTWAWLCGESRSHRQYTLPMLYKRGALRSINAAISSATNGSFTAFSWQILLTLLQIQKLPPGSATAITATGLTIILACAGAGRFYMSITGGRRVDPLMRSPELRAVSGRRDRPSALTLNRPAVTLSDDASGIGTPAAAGHLGPLEMDTGSPQPQRGALTALCALRPAGNASTALGADTTPRATRASASVFAQHDGDAGMDGSASSGRATMGSVAPLAASSTNGHTDLPGHSAL